MSESGVRCSERGPKPIRLMSEQFYGYFESPGSSSQPHSQDLFQAGRAGLGLQLVPQIKHPQIHPPLLVGHNKELWPSFFIIHQPFYIWCLCYVSPGLTSTYSTLCPQSIICMVCTYFRTNSNHFLIQHSVTGFTTENACVFWAV